MKRMTRIVAFLLAIIIVVSAIPPVDVEAMMSIPIRTAEDFMMLSQSPYSSYRLENSIDLGHIAPLGQFSGSLDGQGHTITYSQSYESGIKNYGLFSSLNNAEIANLNINGKISLDISEKGAYHVGLLAGSVAGGSLGGGKISGSVDISGSAGNVVVGGVAGEQGYYRFHMQGLNLSVDVSAHTSGSQSCSYYGTVPDGSPVDSFLKGSVDMSGNIYTVCILQSGNDNHADVDVTVESQGSVYVTGVYSGERNHLYGSYHVTGSGGNVIALDGGSGNTFEGDIISTGVGAMMADGVRGAEIKGNITATNCSATGMRYCNNSTMNGNITVDKSTGGTIYGLSKCNESIFNGNITYNAVGQCRIYCAYDSNHVQVNGSMVLNQKKADYNGNGGVYGLIECPDSSFNGSIRASGHDVHAVGACNAGYDVVNADITVESQLRSSASGVGDNSSFNGNITAKNGSVTGCGNNSIAKGTLTGQTVTATGDKSYFSGTITARYNGGDNQYTSASVGYAADATITVEGGKHGAHFHMGGYFGGTANVSAQDGYVTAECHYGKNVSMSHRASGVSADSSTVLGDRDTHGEVYWHRHAAKYGHEKNGCDGYIYFGWHSYYHNCYDTILGVAYSDAPVKNLSDVDWPNGIDPVNGTYKPERDPVDYVLKVSVGGMDCYNYRLSIGGQWRYPDSSGCVAVEQGPSVISPLVVELRNQDGSYSRVLTRSAYYPVPNMVNTILLEPQLDKIAFSFMETGYSGNEASERWGGIKAELFGKEVPLVDCPMEMDITALDYQFSVEEEKLGENRWGYRFSLGKTEGDGNTKGKLVKVLQKEAIKFAGTEMSIGGNFYVEADFDPNVNQWEVVGGNFGVEADVGGNFTYYIYGPIYVNLGIRGGGSGTGGVVQIADSDSVDSVKFAPDGKIAVSAGGEVALGAGLRSVDFFIEGGGEGDMEWSWNLPHRTGRDSITIQMQYNGFVTYRYIWGGTKITTQKGTYQLWPMGDMTAMQLAEKSFTVLPRTYLSAGADQNQETEVTMELSDSGYATQSGGNAYPYSQLQLLGLDDGRYVLLYTDDDISRDDADRSALRARIGSDVDGQIIWGDAVTIENDGTGDYAFTACASYNEVAVVWQDMDRTFGTGEGVDLEDSAAYINLTQAVLDCSGDVPQVTRTAALTSGAGKPESLPMIFYYADSTGETLRTAWTTSTAKSPISADENTKYTLWVSEAFGQAGQAVKDNMSYVTGIALYADELLWSTMVEDSSDLWYRDGAGNISQQRQSGVANLQSVGHRYIFTEGENLMVGEWGFDNCGLQSVSESNRNMLRLTSTGEIYYVLPGLETSRIYWLDNGIARNVGEYSGYISSWDGANNQIMMLLRTGFSDSDTATLINRPRQDVEDILLEVVCENQQAVPGTDVIMYVEMENRGTWDHERLYVSVVADDGTVLYEGDQEVHLNAGETGEMILTLPIPEGFATQDVTLQVGYASQRITLGGVNLALSAQWNRHNPDSVLVTVKNTGNGETGGTVTMTDSNGRVLGVKEVNLAVGAIQQLWMDLEESFAEETELTVSLEESEDALYTGDNRATVIVEPVYASALVVPSGLKLEVGEKKTMEVHPLPKGTWMTGVQYTSAQPKIATVDANGLVTGVSDGATTITVKGTNGTVYSVEVVVGEGGQNSGGEEEPAPDPNDPKPEDPKPEDPKPEDPKVENPFEDITADQFCYDAVLWAYENNITTGKDATHFDPSGNCTRAQVVTFLWRAAGEPEPTDSKNPFPDVAEGKYYTKAVLWAVEKGITAGYKDGTFGPNKTCTRDQIVTFLWRYAGKPAPKSAENTFPDVKEGAFYTDAVLWAVEEGITTGYKDGTFGPSKTCKRDQIVTFLYRYMVD